MDVLRTLIVILMASLVAACSALSDGSEPTLVADDAALVKSYEDFLEHHPFDEKSDQICFQLAMLHLKPGSTAYDVGKARTRLWQLAVSPNSPYAEGAERILGLLSELDQLRGESSLKARSIERLAEDAARLGEAANVAEYQVAEKRESVEQLLQELKSLRGRIGRLSEENTSQKQQIERLAGELQALKRIDVQQMR